MPTRLTGTEFERLVDYRLSKYRDSGLADVRRAGVQAIHTPDGWQVIPSRPDFEGPTIRGHVDFDCKVCSQASFSLDKYRAGEKTNRRRQLKHLYERARYGVRCFFLLHWNERRLETKYEPAITYMFPVHEEMDIWQKFERAEVKSLKRSDCEEYGTIVPWTCFGARGRRLEPDILAVL
ncbi:MAG: hypothetical protein NXI32_18190 [bacterium]|nr:hypothetical protein [bacterium]